MSFKFCNADLFHPSAVFPYSAQHYNSLPSIVDALLTTTIGRVLIKHKVQKLFGIILLHTCTIISLSMRTKFSSAWDLWLCLGRLQIVLNGSAMSEVAHGASQSKA
jgi:hypothetical protein